MTKRQVELIPEKVSDEVKAMMDPEGATKAIRFLADEVTQMFRELSEHRSQTEGHARQILSRRQTRLLNKLHELFPDNPSIVESAYGLMAPVLETHFERQRGKKFK